MVGSASRRGRLFRKYVLLFAGIVSAALIANGLLDIWFSYREQKALLIRIQREQADAAATKITHFVKEIEGQLGWTTQLAWSAGNIEQRRLQALRLLRQVPAITELTLLDPSGREQLKVSRLTMDVVASQTDRSKEPAFVEAAANPSVACAGRGPTPRPTTTPKSDAPTHEGPRARGPSCVQD